ncbi:unnamed protein product [Cochlearia groenlandica]
MAKKGGTKKKIKIEKITKQESLRPTFTKRKYGLFSKASQLCLLSCSQIAILTTPPSSDSNVSFHSFGHSSVETLADAYLTRQRPPVLLSETKETREDIGVCMSRNDLGLGFWWDDEKLNRSENPQELREAMESMSTLLKSLKNLNIQPAEDTKNKSQLVVHETQEETEMVVFDDDDMDVFNEDLPSSNLTGEHDLILSVCQSFGKTDNNNALETFDHGECSNINQEMDTDQFVDFGTNCEDQLMDDQLINSGAVVDNDDDDVSMEMMIRSSPLDEDNLRFSDFFD